MAEDKRNVINQIPTRYMDMSTRKVLRRMQESTGIDIWLEKEGYYRKHAPREPSCLFRAFSEEVYLSQYHHLRVRQECVQFMRENKYLFENTITVSFDHYLEQMLCFTEWGSINEIRAMSLCYKRDVIIFYGQKQTIEKITNNGFERNVMLCYTPPKQYEIVYTMSHIQTKSYCQYLIYQNLYKHVFKIPDVEDIAHKMLHDRNTAFRHDRFFQKGNLDIREKLTVDLYNEMKSRQNNTDEVQSDLKGLPSIPYKVAKALDPHIYRNTDLDIWHEMRQEAKYAGWNRYNSNELQVGGKCLINCNELFDQENDNNFPKPGTSGSNNKNMQQKSRQGDSYYTGYIQEMNTNTEPVLVFIQDLGEIRYVPYTALKAFPSVKKNKQTNPIIHNKKGGFADAGRRWKKTYNLSSRKKKDALSTTNGFTDSIHRDDIDNVNGIDKSDFEIDGCDTGTIKEDQCYTPENCISEDSSNYATNNDNLSTIITMEESQLVKTNSVAQEVGEERKKTNAIFIKHNIDNSTFKKPTRSGISNNYNNTIQNSCCKPKVMGENYCQPHIGNSQVNTGANSNLFYIFPDGSSYPVFQYPPGNFGDFEQMERLISPRYICNLSMEYYRPNQMWNYGTVLYGSGHHGAQLLAGASSNTDMNNIPYVQEEIPHLVNAIQSCSLTNETIGYNSDKKDISVESVVPKASFSCTNNVKNSKQPKQGSSRNFNSKDPAYQSLEKKQNGGIATKGNKSNKARSHHIHEQPKHTQQYWGQYIATLPSTSANTYDSRVTTRCIQQQHLNPIMQQQQQQTTTNSVNACTSYVSSPNVVFPTMPLYSNEMPAAEACCHFVNGSFVPLSCIPPPPAQHDVAETASAMPPPYPPHLYPPVEPNVMCPPIMFQPQQMQFPPMMQQQLPPPPPPPPLNVQEHWYPMLGPLPHYVQYTTTSAPIITESCNGSTSRSA